MKIEYVHASKFGNGQKVAAAFAAHMESRGDTVAVHHIRELNPRALPPAELYVFSSPGRFGKPLGAMRRFVKKVTLPAGTPCAVLTTEIAPRPDKTTGRLPTEDEPDKYQRVRPILRAMLADRGLTEVAVGVVHVTGIKGPLEDGWETIVENFATRLAAAMRGSPQAA